MFRRSIVGFGLLAFAAYVYAEPITVTQTFSNVSYDNYGITSGVGYGQTPTGDWIFKGTVDSNAANIATYANTGAYQLTNLTLTQASLGLFDVGITNAPVLFFYSDRFGFALNDLGQAPWTVIVYEPDHFASAHTLEQYLALITTPLVNDSYTSFGPQWDGFTLEDGRHLYGWGFGVGTPAVSPVPVPRSFSLLLVGFGPLAYAMQHRKAT